MEQATSKLLEIPKVGADVVPSGQRLQDELRELCMAVSAPVTAKGASREGCEIGIRGDANGQGNVLCVAQPVAAS